MTPILHLRKRLTPVAPRPDVQGVTICSYAGPQDIGPWLEIRNAACAGLAPPVRSWTDADFHREFLMQPWWRPERLWLAKTADAGPVGTVALAQRRGSNNSVAAVHWLAVLPGFRGRGIARLLMWQLEMCCRHLGWQEVHLETHRNWTAAVALYQSLGYEPLRTN